MGSPERSAHRLRHLGAPLLTALSKWDTTVGTLDIEIADLRCFLRHDVAADGRMFGTSERHPLGRCSRLLLQLEGPFLGALVK